MTKHPVTAKPTTYIKRQIVADTCIVQAEGATSPPALCRTYLTRRSGQTGDTGRHRVQVATDAANDESALDRRIHRVYNPTARSRRGLEHDEIACAPKA